MKFSTAGLLLLAGIGLIAADTDYSEQRENARNYQRLGDNAVNKLSEVINLLKNTKDNETRYHLLGSLSEIGSAAAPALPEIVKALNISDTKVRMAAMRALVSINKPCPDAVSPLVKLITNQSTHRVVRSQKGAAAAALAVVCTDPEVFKSLLLFPNKEVRMTMATALATHPELAKQLAPEIAWACPTVFQTGPSWLPDGGFESEGKTPFGWTLHFRDGAKGSWQIDTSRVRNGKQALKLTKTNGMGYLELRSSQPLIVPAGGGIKTWRGFYHSENAPKSSLLLFRLEDEKGEVSAHDNVPRSGWAYCSQTYIRNSAPEAWRKRLLMLRPDKKERRYHLIVRLYGNPCTVWLDDFTFPSTPWNFIYTSPVPSPPGYSLKETMDMLQKRPDSTSELGSSKGRTELRIDGKTVLPIFHFPWKTQYGNFKKFGDAGVHIHNVVLPINNTFGKYRGSKPDETGAGPVWKSIRSEKYDFSSFFSQLREFARKSPNSYILLGFHVAWPTDYVQQNPDTAWVNEKGQYGYGHSLYMLGFTNKEKKPKNMIFWPSPYNDKPFTDAAKVITAFLKELKKTPYSKMVIGGFICGGHDGQFEVLLRDFSKAGTGNWRKWLKKEYKTDKALQQAWHIPEVTLNTASVPVNYYESPKISGVSPEFYDPVREAADRDYKRFRQERIWWMKEYMIKTIKDGLGKKCIGVTWLMGGTLKKYLDPFLKSKYLDIVITQPLYQHRMAGLIGGVGAPFGSFRMHKKLYLEEFDFRSWLRETYDNEIGAMKIGTPTSLQDFQALHRKAAGQLIVETQGWWYFDLSHNAFWHPDILKEVKRTIEVYHWVDSQPQNFKPDVCMVLNDSTSYGIRNSIYRFRDPVTWQLGYQWYELFTAGVPFDTYLITDIVNNPQLQKYKVYVFANAFELTALQRSFIENKLKRNGKTIIWHYAPGYIRNKYDINGVQELTGIKVKTALTPANYRVKAERSSDPLCKGMLPLQGPGDIFRAHFSIDTKRGFLDSQRFTIDDPQAITLGRFVDDNSVAIAVKRFPQWTSIYVASLAGISAELLNNAAIEAKAYTLSKPGFAQMAMNGSFISLHALKTGTITLKLPRRCKVVDAFTSRELCRDSNQVKLTMNAGESRWLLLK